MNKTPVGVSIAATVALIGGVAAPTLLAPHADAAPLIAAASSTVTKVATGTTNVRSGPGTNYGRVGSVAKGTKVTGTLVSGNWLKISSPAQYAGKYIAAYVMGNVSSTTTPPATGASATRYANGTTNVRSGPGTNYSTVGSVASGTKVTGTLTSNGWMKISTPSQYAGKYIAAYVMSTSAPAKGSSNNVGDTPLPMWIGYSGVKVYSNTSGAVYKAVPVNTGFQAKFINADWSQISSGPDAGKYLRNVDITSVDPAHPPLGNPSLPSSRAPIGQVVTRWVAGDPMAPTWVVVHPSQAQSSADLGHIRGTNAVTGKYVNSDWFQITSGTYAGKYVSAGMLLPSSNIRQFNGNKPAKDMCALPSWAQNNWEPSAPRVLDCSAEKAFVAMNTAFKAHFGYNMLVDETYRDLNKQNFYIKMKGYPLAAMPGTSNHGYGTAVDLDSQDSAGRRGTATPYTFYSAAYNWLNVNGPKFGWYKPAYLQPSGVNPEYWHYNYVG